MAHYGLGRGLDALIARKAPISSPSLAPSSAPTPDPIRLPVMGEMAITVDINLIDANPDQPRKLFKEDELFELAQSIREYGVIQPLIVTQVDNGRYHLIAGERRLRASKIAGRKTLPVYVRTAKQHEDFAVALVENIQRVDLNPIEIAKAYQRLIDDFGFSHQELGDKIGQSRVKVSNQLRILALPQEIQDAVSNGSLQLSAARTILSIRNPEDQLKFFHDLGEDKSYSKIYRTIRNYSHVEYKPKAHNVDPELEQKQELLREYFGTRVTITKIRKGSGSIQIEFFSPEEMTYIINKIIQQ